MRDYKRFLRGLVVQLNAGRRDRLKVEMQYLKALPDARLESTKRVKVKVDSGSVIYVDRNVYSVNSRLIGEQVEARLSAEEVEVWYAGQKVEQMPRLRGRGKHRVDYRHIIDWLVRKPGAFENYRYRDELFPTSRFRMAWDTLRELKSSRSGQPALPGRCLQLAAQGGRGAGGRRMLQVSVGGRRDRRRQAEWGSDPHDPEPAIQRMLPVTHIAVVEVAR